MKLKKTMLASLLGLALAPQAQADFREAFQTSTPGQIQLVPSHYEAGTLRDKEGNKREVAVEKTGIEATLKGKTKRWFGQVTIPYVAVANGQLEKKGIGDITLEAGPRYHTGHWELLPTLRAKLPTGAFEAGKVNIGTGQTDLAAVLRGTGMYGPLTLDAGIAYTHRFGTPADRIELRGTPGVGLGKYLRTGIEGVVTLSLDDARTARLGPGLVFAKDGWQVGGFMQKEFGVRQVTEGWTYRFIFRVPIK